LDDIAARVDPTLQHTCRPEHGPLHVVDDGDPAAAAITAAATRYPTLE
jgi:hypothetical protein